MSYITVDELRIASPCQSAEWADGEGEHFSRLCKTCDKNVYNLSLMTLDEANDLIREKKGKLCISLYHGFNGKVLTADSPIALRKFRRKYLITRAKIITFAIMIWGLITGTTTSCSPIASGPPNIIYDNFSADINGLHFVTSTEGATDTKANEIKINANLIDSLSLWIYIDSTEFAQGTYENHHGIYEAGGYKNNLKIGKYLWYTGELKITSFSPSKVSGTFWFNAVDTTSGADTIYITNGKFDVPVN